MISTTIISDRRRFLVVNGSNGEQEFVGLPVLVGMDNLRNDSIYKIHTDSFTNWPHWSREKVTQDTENGHLG